MISLSIYKVLFMIELLIVEFLFVFRLKRRSHFYLRLLGTVAVCLLIAVLVPVLAYNAIYSSVLFLVLLAVTVGGLFFCFEEKWMSILYCAVAAYTVRHLAFQFFSLYLTIVSGSGSLTNSIYSNTNEVFSMDTGFVLTMISYFSCYMIVYVLAYTLFAQKIGEDGEFEVEKPYLMSWVLVILFVDIVLNAIVVYNSAKSNYANEYVLLMNTLTSFLYNMLCCFFMLFILYNMIDMNKLKRDLEITNQILQEERKQYTISKENIELINLKCHDLKYQVRQIVESGGVDANVTKEIENLISIYDSMLKTGNEALDIIFTEKCLVCNKNDIKLNCMIDGARLSFMETTDIYVLFGNLMDNAMEAVQKLDDPEKRIISMNVYSEMNLLFIVMSNYYEGEIKLREDGLPITTKKEKVFHGLGMRSVSLLVEKYGGQITYDGTNGIFSVNIMLPLTEEEENA